MPSSGIHDRIIPLQKVHVGPHLRLAEMENARRPTAAIRRRRPAQIRRRKRHKRIRALLLPDRVRHRDRRGVGQGRVGRLRHRTRIRIRHRSNDLLHDEEVDAGLEADAGAAGIGNGCAFRDAQGGADGDAVGDGEGAGRAVATLRVGDQDLLARFGVGAAGDDDFAGAEVEAVACLQSGVFGGFAGQGGALSRDLLGKGGVSGVPRLSLDRGITHDGVAGSGRFPLEQRNASIVSLQERRIADGQRCTITDAATERRRDVGPLRYRRVIATRFGDHEDHVPRWRLERQGSVLALRVRRHDGNAAAKSRVTNLPVHSVPSAGFGLCAGKRGSAVGGDSGPSVDIVPDGPGLAVVV